MILKPKTFYAIVKRCLEKDVGLVIDRYDTSWIYINPNQVSTCTMDEEHTISWDEGTLDVVDISAVRCGGKKGEFLKEMLGEDRAKEVESAFAKIKNDKKN